MRPAAIAAIGFVFLILIFAGISYVRIALFCLALIPLLLILVGFIWRFRGPGLREFWIGASAPSSPVEPAPEGERFIAIEGRSFPLRNLPPRMDFKLRLRNTHVLTAIALVGIGSVVASVVGRYSAFTPPDMDSPNYIEIYFLCYLMVVLWFPALAWLNECALIRQPGITLADVRKRAKGGLGNFRIQYHFIGPDGSHYGGSVVDFGGPKNDDFKVVFCSMSQPDVNKLSCGFLFHRTVWADQV